MKRQFTFQQYRSIDLFFFVVMLLISENVIHAAIHWFPGELYTVSVVAALTAILLMRWGPWAGINAVLGGALFCFLSGGTGRQYLIYMVGNLFSLLALLLFKVWDRETVRNDPTRSVVFALIVQALMQVGRAAVALLFGASPGECLAFFTTDALSYVFAAVIVWIARRLDGIFEDQKHYLLRIHSAEGEEKGGS